ncbi:MAG TPA: hypothetical protein VFA34_02360 [Actinomycetota bacterium]|nr:hypothetical protein [Actinomycetota bacterium]
MRRFAIATVLAGSVLAAGTALASTRSASIGNYWYQDDATGDRSKIVVTQGDQVAFTVREGIYPPHTVDVDELNIHSPGILLGETYTTPALTKVGNFRLYCRPHEARGHVSRLIVRAAAPASTAAPTGTAATPPPPGAAVTTTPVASAAPSPAATLAPVGVSKAAPGALDRPVAVDPDSLEGLTGRARSTQPWTRAVWFLVIATVPIVAAAGFAVRRELVRVSSGTSRSSPSRARSRARSPRSSTRRVSGSGRTSRGRKR